MRVLYGVHGYGQGHASRALPIIRELIAEGHEVIAVAGGRAFDFLCKEVRTQKVDCFTFEQSIGTKTDMVKTTLVNFPKFVKLLFRVQDYQSVKHLCKVFAPDAIITDSEPYTAWVGKDLGIPVMCLDHYGVIACADAPIPLRDIPQVTMDKWAYRRLIPSPDARIISSFYAPVSKYPIVKPLIRKELTGRVPPRGQHYVAYFSSGMDYSEILKLKRLKGLVLVFHDGPARRDGNIQWVPKSRSMFDYALIHCRGVISSAGNQIIGEAIHLGKPIYVIPEDSVEQRLNASYVARMEVGLYDDCIDADTLDTFMRKERMYHYSSCKHRGSGLVQAMRHLRDWFAEIG